MPGRSLWSGSWPRLGRGCSWRSPRRAPGRPRRCGHWPPPGPRVAGRWWDWPRRRPPPPNSATSLALTPTRWPSSPGPSSTMTCLVGRSASGQPTLVVIDEAGMADTLSLDTAVQYVISRGGSVRLIGDDQQLAAIGAGGVIRDIAHTNRAVRLTELVRFTDPAEGAASLALRDGRPEALGFYLDHRLVHIGDLAAITDEVFSAWQADRTRGLDAIMLAPTRDLASQLNQRARSHRLAGEPETRVLPTAGE